MDEYNVINIRNDELPKNAYASVTIKNDIGVAETVKVSELSEKVIEEAGSLHTAPLAVTTTRAAEAQKISTAVSQVTVTASAVTVVAAVVAVAVVTTTTAAATVAAPLASVTGAAVKYYNYGSDVCIEFVLEDEEDELESLYAWIEDGAGQEITCEITADGGVYLANAELTGETSGEPIFVVYCITADGWEGELYRGAIALPTAPGTSVEYAAEYNAETGELAVTYELDDARLNGYTIYIADANGGIESTVDYAARTITATVDGADGLYLIITAEAANGWNGEIFNELMTVTELSEEAEQPTEPETPEEEEPTVTPTAPDVGVEYTTAYNADTGGLTIIYELYDDNGELSGYTVQIFDSVGSEVTSIVDYTANTVTLPETDAAAELYLIITAEAANGWNGEIYNEAIEIPSAPDVTVSEAWNEGYEGGGEAYMYVYFTGDAADVAFSYWFEDDYGNIIACEFVEQTEEYVCVYAAFDGSVDFTLDERGRLSFVVSATTEDGWTGEIYREKFVIEPVAPDVEVTDVTVTSYSYDTTLTVQFTVEDIDGEISEYEAWYKDADGKISVCGLTRDGYVITATADVSGLDVSGGLILRVYVVTNDGWYGNLNDSDLTLPTAPDLTAEVLMDNMYESYGVIYVNIAYTGDTSVISAYEYWFEDEDGNKYVYDLGDVDDGAVSGSAEFTAEDNPVLDTYGRMDFVIAVTTTDGWTGEIYREKEEIAYDGYLTYPELTGVTINYYETDIYTAMQITAYDPDGVWLALYITLTDANTTLDLTGDELSVEIGVETDAEGITTYYVYVYDTTITPFEDGTVKVYLLADYYNDEGNISDYVVVDAYYTVTVTI